jgi:hypothetical protein
MNVSVSPPRVTPESTREVVAAWRPRAHAVDGFGGVRLLQRLEHLNGCDPVDR